MILFLNRIVSFAVSIPLRKPKKTRPARGRGRRSPHGRPGPGRITVPRGFWEKGAARSAAVFVTYQEIFMNSVGSTGALFL